MRTKPISILLVEDNEGDILLTTEAFEDGKISNELVVARDGQEAVDLLNGHVALSELDKLPDLILLDVNLPRLNGHEVLSFIKNHDLLKHIPVIMLTTSSAESDILKSYQNHANCFITKPVEINEFMQAINTIENYWLSIVKLADITNK